MMKRHLITALAAGTILSSPAFAREGAVYVELDGGVMQLEDMNFDIGATNNGASIDSEYGYDFGGIVGYDFGGFRLEAEVSFREADPDNIRSTIGIPTVGAGQVTATTPIDFVAGDTSALSGMVNALVDFGPDDGLQFFAGGGVGYAKVDVDASVNAAGNGFIDDSDEGFAWQLLAGVRAPVTDTIDAGLKYRFFNVNNVNLTDSIGRDIETRFRSHSILGTLTFNFGGAERVEEVVMPPAPAYTPPPPPPPVYTPPPPPPPVVDPRVGERG